MLMARQYPNNVRRTRTFCSKFQQWEQNKTFPNKTPNKTNPRSRSPNRTSKNTSTTLSYPNKTRTEQGPEALNRTKHSNNYRTKHVAKTVPNKPSEHAEQRSNATLFLISLSTECFLRLRFRTDRNDVIL